MTKRGSIEMNTGNTCFLLSNCECNGAAELAGSPRLLAEGAGDTGTNDDSRTACVGARSSCAQLASC